MHARVEQSLAVAGRELGGAEAHVPPQADAQIADGLAGEAAEHVREGARDLLGRVAIDLLAVDAPDVIRLEDVGVEAAHGR